jgi:HEAT repeats
MRTGATKTRVGAGAVLLAVLVGLWLWRSGRTEESRDTPSAGDGGRPTETAPAPATGTKSLPPGGLLQPVPCALEPLVEEYRQGKGSPAYRRYVVEQLRGLVETLPPEQLWAKLEAEQDPEVLEALSALGVTRFNLTGERSVLERLVDKTAHEPDARRRAVMVGALKVSGEPASEVLARSESTRHAYREWVKDAAPEVREAVVENLKDEARRGFGRSQGVAEQAVALAREASDPKTAAGLLGASSLEGARTPAVNSVHELLQKSEHPEVRAAAAKALGTVAVGEAGRTMKVLTERFATEGAKEVRSAILEGIAHLGLSNAEPVLRRLKGVHGEQDGELDTWLELLASKPQTWTLLQQDKQAREHRRGQGG